MIFQVLKELVRGSSGSMWWVQFNLHFLYPRLYSLCQSQSLQKSRNHFRSSEQEVIYHRELEAYKVISRTWRGKLRKATPDFQKI